MYIYTHHCYKIANTPILQSRNPPVSFPCFVLTLQCISSNFIFQFRIPPLFFGLDVANRLHNIMPSPFLCFWIANLFRTPSTADPHFFYYKDLFNLSFSGVTCIYVTPTLSMLAIELSPRNFAFGLALPLLSIFGHNTHCISFFFYQLLLPRSLLLQSTTAPPPPRTYNLSLPCVISE